jgi:hypothetical protein
VYVVVSRHDDGGVKGSVAGPRAVNTMPDRSGDAYCLVALRHGLKEGLTSLVRKEGI